jgi:NAD(P)H dehydrogenase (quinone)
MYAITGITGKVGGSLARNLLSQGKRVRAVVRDAIKGEEWAALGCDVAIASMQDASALTAAFRGVAAAFVLPPPVFDPSPGYPEMRLVIDAVAEALQAARPERILCLSTIGAQASQDNLLTQLSMMEEKLSTLSCRVTFLRPAWFLDNAAWDVAAADNSGLIHSFLMPAVRPIPMVSTTDVGRVAADLIQDEDPPRPIVELEGPQRLSPNDLASAFARALRKPVRAEIVPRDTWEALFRAQGMKNPTPRIRMLDGFNEGWLSFSSTAAETQKGSVGVDEAIGTLVSLHLRTLSPSQ